MSDKANIKIALKKSKLPSASGLVKPTLPAPKTTKENKPKKKERPQKTASTENLTDDTLSLISSSQESVSSSQDTVISNDLRYMYVMHFCSSNI